MKAARLHDGQGVDKYVYEDAPDPTPGPGEVLIRVKACALNHLEVWDTIRPGPEKPRICGADVAGVVADVGPGVTGVEVGSKVMLQPGLSCGRCEACLAGDDNACPSYRILGRVEDGGLAQFTKVPVANLIPMPDNLTFEGAASIPLVFVTAWHMLVTRARVSMNDTVLVNAAGSGVGIAGVQIAKLFGARVIASAGSDAKLEKAKALGADEVINYNTHDLAQETLRLTGGRGVDLVFEHIGAKVFEQSLDALARYGRLVTCGVTAGPQATLDVGRLMRNRQTIIGSFMGTKGELLRMMRHFKEGSLKPVVDRAYPLAEIKAAVNQLASRDHFGKIVLVPPE